MAQQPSIAEEKISSGDVTDDPNKSDKKQNLATDPEFYSYVLQPSPADFDPNYIGIRRLLLFRKAQSGVLRRKDWRCNGKDYAAYRNYISRPRNWESLIPGHSSTPGNSGRWASSSGFLSHFLEVDSLSMGRDMRNGSQALSRSSSNVSDRDFLHRRSEPAYSFIGDALHF